MKQIKGLDTLRAFSVLFVIVDHFGVSFDDTSPSGSFIKNVIIPNGGFGVMLFFVLSGFLITSILLNAKETDQNKISIIKTFFLRRALRIFPIYYLLCIILYIANYPEFRHMIGWYITYCANFYIFSHNEWGNLGHTWSLDVEEQFYLIWPWLIVFVPNKYLAYIFSAFVLVGLSTTWYAIEVQHHFAAVLMPHFLSAFGLGGMLAWSKQDSKWDVVFFKITNILAMPSIVIYFYMRTVRNGVFSGLFWYNTVIILIVTWIIALVLNNKSKRISKYLLENRVLNYIGKISYGVYLYHAVYINGYCNPVNKWIYINTLQWPAFNKFVHDHHTDYYIQLSIMFGIAALSYHFIEKPILKLKDKFAY